MPTPLSNEKIIDLERCTRLPDCTLTPWWSGQVADLIFTARHYMNEAEANGRVIVDLMRERHQS